MRILAIESSCDETAAAIVEDGTKILSSTVSTSTKMHEQFGGILPEVAAREQLGYIIPVLKTVLEPFAKSKDEHPYETLKREINAIAVSVGPGLIGSLLIGVETAKTISFVTGIPLIPVNHVHAHIYANFIHSYQKITHLKNSELGTQNPASPAGRSELISFPAIALVVSGGHTELFLMKSEKELEWLSGTIDDAAGEAFDKTARLLGFGNRGGVAIQEAAFQFSHNSQPITHNALHLPRPMLHDDTLNFSFSGLKTAVLREWQKQTRTDKPKTGDQNLTTDNRELITEFAHEIQEAITDVLVTKTLKAAEQYGAQSILVGGGVAANKRLREKFSQHTTHNPQLTTFFPPVDLCTDTAVTIGSCAFFRGKPTDWHTVTAVPDLSVETKE